MGEYPAAVLDRVFSAVSDPTRRAILARLAESDARVTDVASAFPISLNSTSKHIRVLEGAGLVRRSVRGREHILSLDGGATGRSGGMDRPLPPVLERPARLARRLRHRARRRGGVVVTDEHSLTVRREIAAPAEDLFDAWLDAGSLGSWLKPSGTRETRAETDPRVGGSFRIVMVDDESSMLHTGTYREIDRPHRLVFTWSSPRDPVPGLDRDRHLRTVVEPLDGGRDPSGRASGRGSAGVAPRRDGPTSCVSSTAPTGRSTS